MIDCKIEGRVALLTGANHLEGIGAAVARALLGQGASVFVTGWKIGDSGPEGDLPEPGGERYDRLRACPIDDLVEELRRSGWTVEGVEWDLADHARIEAVLDAVEAQLGSISILINNAAHWSDDTFRPGDVGAHGPMIDALQHDRHFAVNTRAPALLMGELARRHIERGARWGRIVNISTDGASGHAGAVSYGASKHALESYSRAAAWELGTYGITVNVVAPGPVQTGWITREMEEGLLSQIPLKRIGVPEDVADVVVFLASDQARWVTGQPLYVGGGHVMPL